MDENNIRKLSREKLNHIDKVLHSIKDDLNEIPHIVLAASQVEGEENIGWMHSQIMARGSELTMMFIQLMKSNKDVRKAIERALGYIRQDEGKGDIRSMIDNAVSNVIKKIAEADDEFMESLKEDMENKSGSDFDVDGLLNEVLGKGKGNKDKEDDDKERDKQE